MHVSDEMLTGFLDGALTQAESDEIAAALSASPELQQRLETLRVPTADLKAGFDALLGEAPAMPDFAAPEESAGWGQWAAVAAALFVGFGLGGWFLRPAAPDWVDVVANYQSLYVTETLSVPAMQAADRQNTMAVLSERLGLELSPLVGLGEIEFRRAQMLGLNGAPLIQMAYLDGDVPIAICVTPVLADDSDVTSDVLYGLQAASWIEGGFGFLVIGGDDRALISKVANSVRAAI